MNTTPNSGRPSLVAVLVVAAAAVGAGTSTALVFGAGPSTASPPLTSTTTVTAVPPPHPVPVYLSKVTINRKPVFHGQVHSGRPCLRHRTVQVRRRSTKRVIGSTTTGRRGGWTLLRSGIHGRFYARVMKKRLVRPRGKCLSEKSRHFLHVR
jgi:hypothetical protein